MGKISIDATNSIKESYRILRKLEYDVPTALFEFVDNSIQSYINDREKLKEVGIDSQNRIVEIFFNRQEKSIVISDNAGGMDEEAIKRAFKPGTPPPDKSGLSEFGLGMKGAAQWLCESWKVETKAVNSSQKYIVLVDDNNMNEDDKFIEAEVIEGEPNNDHYTEIELFNLQETVTKTQIDILLEKIGAVYGRFIKAWGLQVIVHDSASGTPRQAEMYFEGGKDDEKVIPYKKKLINGVEVELIKKFNFEIDDGLENDESKRKVEVKALVFLPGAAAKAGIHIFRRQRIIEGGRHEGRKPYSIFKAPNSFISQRLYIECEMDGWPVSASKRKIRFPGDSYEKFLSELEKNLRDGNDYIDEANTLRTKKGGDGEDTTTHIDAVEAGKAVVEEVKDVLNQTYMEIDNSPYPDVLKDTEEVEGFTKELEPNEVIEGSFGSGFSKVYIYYTKELASTDKFIKWDFNSDKVMILVINLNHPHCLPIASDKSRLTEYFRHCLYDAIIQSNMSAKGDRYAGSFLYIKDQYLRKQIDINEID